jgi:hypothetical protein
MLLLSRGKSLIFKVVDLMENAESLPKIETYGWIIMTHLVITPDLIGEYTTYLLKN